MPYRHLIFSWSIPSIIFPYSFQNPYQHLTDQPSYSVKSQVDTDIFSWETSYDLKSNIVILELMIFLSKLPSPSNIFCHTTSYTSNTLMTEARTSSMSPAWHTHIISAADCIFLVSARLWLLQTYFRLASICAAEVPMALKMFHSIIWQRYVIKSPQSYGLGKKDFCSNKVQILHFT